MHFFKRNRCDTPFLQVVKPELSFLATTNHSDILSTAPGNRRQRLFIVLMTAGDDNALCVGVDGGGRKLCRHRTNDLVSTMRSESIQQITSIIEDRDIKLQRQTAAGQRLTDMPRSADIQS